MRSLGVRNGKTVYEAQIGVGDTPNLLWYRFEGETREGRVVLGAAGPTMTGAAKA